MIAMSKHVFYYVESAERLNDRDIVRPVRCGGCGLETAWNVPAKAPATLALGQEECTPALTHAQLTSEIEALHIAERDYAHDSVRVRELICKRERFEAQRTELLHRLSAELLKTAKARRPV